MTPSPQPPPAPDLTRFYDQRLSWSGCGGRFQCTHLTVPVDYAHPGGRTTQVAVIRLPASDPAHRIGSLILNPGGPGGSGIDYAKSARAVVSAAVRDRYDIVGFDPRGVASSAPVKCLGNAQLDSLIALDGSPDTPAEERALVQASRALAAGCSRLSGPLLGHVDTPDVARDLDVLRAALGDHALFYLGKSYGTYLGATYAELFPKRVGRMVLDGALDPRSTFEGIDRAQAIGFETALASFVDDCLGRSDCPLRGTRAQALGQIDQLLAAADAQPLRSDQGRPVTQALVVLGIVTAMYDSGSGWPLLRQALAQALKGDGSTLLLLSDYYTNRAHDGTYVSNEIEANIAVNCLDHPAPTALAVYRADAIALAKVSPRFGAYIAWGPLPCAYWPYPPLDRPHAIHAKGAAPILVVGTTRDPATPYQWAVALARELTSGVLLTYVGDGHTAYRRSNSCIDSAVDAYLLTGAVPAAGTRC